jgi:hypothetical protein
MQAGINFLYEPRERSHFGTEYRKEGGGESMAKGEHKDVEWVTLMAAFCRPCNCVDLKQCHSSWAAGAEAA